MKQVEFDALLERGYETSGVEFKGPGKPSDSELFAKVVRALLGMANRREGGMIILGVTETGKGGQSSPRFGPVGLSDEEFRLWMNYDDISQKINSYARPSVVFDLEPHEIPDGKKFVIVRVREFDDIPILCTKDYASQSGDVVLRGGACYVRSRRKPETAEIPTEEDMRALLESATDKGVLKFLNRARRAGLFSPAVLADGMESVDPYERQIEEVE